MVCGWTIHRSVPGHKQVNSVANVLNLQTLADIVHRLGARGDGGAAVSIALAAESKMSPLPEPFITNRGSIQIPICTLA
jgi:hypothetical protein